MWHASRGQVRTEMDVGIRRISEMDSSTITIIIIIIIIIILILIKNLFHQYDMTIV